MYVYTRVISMHVDVFCIYVKPLLISLLLQTRMVQALTTIIKRKTRATSAARRNSVLPLEDGQSSPTKDTEREEKDKDKDKEKEREKEKERTWVRGGTVSSPMSSISSSSLLFGGKEETKGERLSPREHKARTNEIESMEQLETILQLPVSVFVVSVVVYRCIFVSSYV